MDVQKNGWADDIQDPDWVRGERKLIIAEAKRRKLSYRLVRVLGRRLRGRFDLHGSQYRGSVWIFVEVPE